MKVATSLMPFAWLLVCLAPTLQATDSAKVSPIDVNPITSWEEPPTITTDNHQQWISIMGEPTLLSITKNSAGEVRGPLSIPLSYFDSMDEGYLHRKLKETGLDINGTNGLGQTLLLQACNTGHKRAVKILCQCRADTNKADENGITPLLASCKLVNAADENITEAAILSCLLLHGANIDGISTKRNKIGWTIKQWPLHTPLFLMLEAGRVDIALFLIKNNASLGKNKAASLKQLQELVYLTEEASAALQEFAPSLTSRRCW
jgi:ankyrin repeat protein